MVAHSRVLSHSLVVNIRFVVALGIALVVSECLILISAVAYLLAQLIQANYDLVLRIWQLLLLILLVFY